MPEEGGCVVLQRVGMCDVAALNSMICVEAKGDWLRCARIVPAESFWLIAWALR